MNSIRILMVAVAAATPIAACAAEVSPQWYGRSGTVVWPRPERSAPTQQREQRIMQTNGVSLFVYKAKPAPQPSTVARGAARPAGG